MKTSTSAMMFGMTLAGLALTVTVPTAQAGTKTSNEVKITDAQRRAEGSMGSARASADGSQYLACTVHGKANDVYMSCSARDAAGLFRSCTSTAPHLITAAKAVRSHSSSSMIVFTWDANYACQTLDVANGSQFLPTYDVPTCASWTNVNINGCDSFAGFTEGDPACTTGSSTVTLNISGTGVPTHMSIYNVPSYETYCNSLTGSEAGWSTPEPMASSKQWTLPAGAGDKKVCVRLKNGAGWGKACGGGIHYTP